MRNHGFVLLALLIIAPEQLAQTRVNYVAISIPTRDNKTLAADLYALDTTKALSVILIQTPYNKNFYRSRVGVPEAGGSAFPYDSLHYNYVVLDWRGRFGSRDAEVPGYDRGLDGYDAVEWIAKQKWSNGKIGTWGGSALGQIQFQTARHHPPPLVCSVPMIKDFKTKYSDYYYGGVFRKEHVESLARLGFLTVQTVLDHPTNDLVWRVIENNSDFPDEIAVPMLLISGWFDHFPDDVIRAFYDLRMKSAAAVRQQHKLLMGPWLHTEVGKAQQGQLAYPNSAGVPDSIALHFFDYYLRGVSNGNDGDPAIRYYQMGANDWRATNDWFALSSTPAAMYLQAGGLLSSIRPAGNVAPDSFRYDPRNPSPAVGGSRFNPFDPATPTGPQDLRQRVESRNDLLIYTTPVLEKDLMIAGAIKVDLFVASNRRDTDFAVRLCDVYPDGRSMILTQGIRRMRFRNSYTSEDLLTPGQVYQVTVELQNLAMTFLQGHRLRVDISSSDYPHFDLNLNNGGALYVAGDMLVATNYIYHDAIRSSRVLLPMATTTGLQETTSVSPASFRLEQNHPNPFNPSTTIRFSLPQGEYVTLKIFDTLGKEVKILASGDFAAGAHTINFEAKSLTSGIYFYRLQARRIFQQKKMLVLR